MDGMQLAAAAFHAGPLGARVQVVNLRRSARQALSRFAFASAAAAARFARADGCSPAVCLAALRAAPRRAMQCRAGKAMGDKRAVTAERAFNRPFKKVVVAAAGAV